MEKRVLIDTWQKVTNEDFLKFGLFPQGSFDTIVGRLLIPDKAFSGFDVTKTGPAEVTVAAGKLFAGGKVFFNDQEGGTSIDLLARLPLSTERIIAITAWGTETDSRLEPRSYLADAESRAVVARDTSTEHWRWCNLSAVSGVEGPDPQPPAVPTDVLTIAWVTCSTTGVEQIRMNLEGMAPNLRGAQNSVNELNIWRLIFGAKLDTLGADMLSLAARIYGLAQFELVRQIAYDVSKLKERARLPDLYTSYGFDHFLVENESDLQHPAWLARIEEGVRFPPAAGFDMQLGLLNPNEPLVINTNNVLLPAWEHAYWLGAIGADGELSIAQYQYQTVDMVQKTMTRTVTRYGTPFAICTNNGYWPQGWGAYIDSHGFTGTLDYIANTFTREGTGEVWDIIDTGVFYTDGNPGYVKPALIRLQKVWTDTIEEPYWDRITTKYSVSGATIGETFVISQDGWLSKIELFFSRVAAAGGSVDVLVTQVTNGQPDPNKVLARATVTAANLKVATAVDAINGSNATEFVFQSTFLRKDRYAIVIMSAGNHFLWHLNNSSSFAGTLFYSTDGSWFQGDLIKDVAFRAYFCRFINSISRVSLEALQLQNGIAAIDINADTVIPQGCRLFYEVQVDGLWHALDDVDGGPDAVFIGLPPLLPFRAVFVGTPSQQPALGVASNSRVTTWRPRTDFCHISKILIPKVATNHLQVDIRLEAWRGPSFHTFLLKLMTGAGYLTETLPTTTVTETAPDDPDNSIIIHCAWTGLPNITSFRLRMNGTTTNVLTTYHVAERFHVIS